MPVEWSEESSYRKEMRKWDTPKRNGGMNVDGFERFPMMLYKAQLNPISNRYEVAMQRDVISADKTVVLLSKEEFNGTCQRIVNSEREYDAARAEGWRDTEKQAMEYHEALQQAVAVAAAERAHQDRNMSPKAQAEIEKAESATAQHLGEIPEQPVRRRGRPRKNTPVPA